MNISNYIRWDLEQQQGNILHCTGYLSWGKVSLGGKKKIGLSMEVEYNC